MKEEKFKIANQTKKLIMDIDTYLVNFPRKEIELKQNIKNSSFKLLLLVYEANASSSTERRITLQEEAIALIKYLDFLINMCYEKQIINSKKYLRFGESLEIILRYVNAWKKAEV